MANTVSTISYANTFGQWMVATDALIGENNTLATGDYNKTSGTLYLNETTKNSLQANGNIVVQKQLLVQGVASAASIDNNLTVAGQIYFSNSILGLTNSGQANINGLLLAQGSGIGLSVTNNAYVGGNTTVQLNTITNNLQANSTVNTGNASITNTVYTNNLTANARIQGAVSSFTGFSYSNILQANSAIVTAALQANNTVNTAIASVSNITYTDRLQANTSTNTATASITGKTLTDTLQANTSILTGSITANTSGSIPTLTVATKLDGNTAAGFLNSLQVQGGGLTVNGNFILTGTTVYASNTFQLSTGVSTGISSYLQAARGSSGVNAAIRWSEPSLYWETLDVTGNIYSRIITEAYLANQSGLYANSAFLKANSAYASQNVSGTYANTAYYTANSAQTYANGAFVQANSAYDSQNTTGLYANSAALYANGSFVQANASYGQANSAGSYANSAFSKANNAYAAANNAVTTYIGTSGTISTNTVSFSSNNGLIFVATSANNFAVSTSQDLRTTATPTFASLVLTAPLPLAQGGTGSTSASSALTALLPTGTTAGYVLTTGGPGNFYWSASSGGGTGATPGTSINSTRLSYTANGASGYTGNSFVVPTATSSTQVRAYINGVRQFESEYTLNLSANTIAFTTTPLNGDAVLIEVDGYYVNPYYANNIAFTVNSNISSTANTIQLAIDGLTTKVVTYYANIAGGSTFTGDVRGVTMPTNTSNTSFATTAYVQYLANNSTYGVYTNGEYSNPSWITSLAASKISGMYYVNQGTGTANNVQHASLGVGTGASGTSGEIRATNNITAYYSDDRLKTRLGTIDNALDKLCSLTGFYYQANETAQALGYGVRREVGVSAQDVQKVLPEIVTAAPIDDKYLTIYYDKLIPLVIEAIKELKSEIDVLKGQIK
jgi:hypothetical protein